MNDIMIKRKRAIIFLFSMILFSSNSLLCDVFSGNYEIVAPTQGGPVNSLGYVGFTEQTYLLVGADSHLYVNGFGGPSNTDLYLMEIDKKGNIKYYGQHNTQFTTKSYWSDIRKIKKWKNSYYWMNCGNGFTVFKEGDENNPTEFLHNYSYDNVKDFGGMPIPEGGTPIFFNSTIVDFCFDETGEYIYYLSLQGDFFTKMRTNNPDTIEKSWDLMRLFAPNYPEDTNKIHVCNYPDMKIDENGLIWIACGIYQNHILVFDTKTDEFSRIAIADLPMDYPEEYYEAYPKRNVPACMTILNQSAKHNYAKMAVFSWQSRLHGTAGSSYHINYLLKYEDSKWENIPIPDSLYNPLEDTLYLPRYNTYQLSEDEIAICLTRNPYLSSPQSFYKQGAYDMLIYNLSTKEWHRYRSPLESSPVQKLTEWQGKKYIITGFSLLEYDNLEVGINEYEYNSSENNLYPNPSYNEVKLEFDTEAEYDIVTIKIQNNLGEIVLVPIENKEYTQGSHLELINVQTLPNGYYYCIIQTQHKSYVKPFVVIR